MPVPRYALDRTLTAVTQLHHLGRYVTNFIQVDVVRFGIGATLLSSPTTAGPFAGRHVADQLVGRAWSDRGLTITRVQVNSTPANRVPCTGLIQPAGGWDLGCRLLGQRPLISDRRGRFPADANSMVSADSISLTATPTVRTHLPADSLRIQW